LLLPLRNLIAHNPFQAEADQKGFLSLLEFDNNSFALAKKHAQETLDNDPQNQNALLTLGLWHLGKETVKDAKTYLQLIIKINPSHQRALTALAVCYFFEKDILKASKILEQDALAHPCFVAVKETLLGWLALFNDTSTKAKTHFEQALVQQGDSIQQGNSEAAHLGQALVYANEGATENAQAAIAAAQACTSADGTSSVEVTMIGALLSKYPAGYSSLANLLATTQKQQYSLASYLKNYAIQASCGWPHLADMTLNPLENSQASTQSTLQTTGQTAKAVLAI
jgi:Tfp pilus assembly protein PilF